MIYTPTVREVDGGRDTPRSPENDPVVSPSNEQKRRGYPENICINTWYRVDLGEKSVESDGGRYGVKADWELVRVASKVLQIDAEGCRAKGKDNQGDYKSKSRERYCHHSRRTGREGRCTAGNTRYRERKGASDPQLAVPMYVSSSSYLLVMLMTALVLYGLWSSDAGVNAVVDGVVGVYKVRMPFPS